MAGESQQEPKTGAPDPTVLTTEQMLLAVSNLEKLVGAWRDTDRSICIEQFDSIRTQLKLIETQRVEQKQDTKAAVDAALAAAKEAVKEQTTTSQLATGKTETSFAEQLRQQEAKTTLAIGGVTDTAGDLKDRVGRIEQVLATRQESRVDTRAGVGNYIAFAAVIATAVIGSVAIIVTVILQGGN